jgi:hypothetical protein
MGVMKKEKKKASPVVAMAELSLPSPKAAMKELTNFEARIPMQQEELSLPKESAKQEVFENNLDMRSGKVIL